MREPRASRRFSLQAKVMIVVVAGLVALPMLTLGIFERRLRRQTELDAELALATARADFVRALEVRARELVVRFRLGRDDPRFQQIVRLQDAATMEDFLRRSVLDELRDDTELALFVSGATGVSGARREAAPATPRAFAAVTESLIQAGLRGEESTATVACGGAAYQAIGLPVALPEGVTGALVFGFRLGADALRNVRPPLSEVMLLAGERVLASTLPAAADSAAVAHEFVGGSDGPRPLVRISGQRYKPAAGRLDEGGVVRYALLTSVEQRLGAFEDARLLLLGLSAIGTLVTAGTVWFFVRRITRPLVALRDSVEAVGRGDFSRRIERFSRDECGDLAEAFNQMTVSLHTSRAELERAMQQVRTTQDQLIQSEKLSAVGQFIAGVAHELNNPLTVVVGFAETLQTRPPDSSLNSYLSRIAKAAHRCHKIVHSLLSFARQHAPERKPVDLTLAIDEVLEIMGYDLRTGNITVRRDIAAGLPAVLADGHQLQQVFINIISNARHAMEGRQEEGVIDIRFRREGAGIALEFADNGPGIKPEHLSRIFDPFFTTKPVGKGTGLGLSLCYGIVQEHGGKISARSEPGHGATFRIELPVPAEAADTEAARAATVMPFPIGDVPPSGKTILVVDDEVWILELAAELLRCDGHAVETAQGGEDALERIARRHFDVIVSDWKMPGMNGVRLCEHLRATGAAAAERIVFMTGDVVNEDFQDFLRQEGLTCLAKPFATSEFRATVARLTKRKAA